MSMMETRRHQLFPTLTAAQIDAARRFAADAEPRRWAPGEIVFAVGERGAPAFLVLAGSIEIFRRDGPGGRSPIVEHLPGQMTGEVAQLAGRPSLVEGRAGKDGCEAAPFDAAHLRALLIGSAELGEIFMRAFILRRTALIADGGAGSVLVGRAGDPALVRIQGFLSRNGHPHTTLDPAADPDGQATLERLALTEADLPLVLCPDGSVLKRPDERQLGACLGMTPDLDPTRIYDVAIVGAGPAGLAAAVYAASEGLSVLVLDSRAFGGQAGASARIENYLGFPTGITGMALMARAFSQAQKFGAEIAIPVDVERLDCGAAARSPAEPFGLELSGGLRAAARSVIIASGARYRRPPIENLATFEGAGVSYWASPVEAKLCAGEVVALVGGGNSAGQAVAFLAPKVKALHLVIRGDGLESSMSRYLIERIAAFANVEIHRRTEIAALQGDAVAGLTGASFRNRDAGEAWTGPLRHLFLFVGADPNTDWLESCDVARDRHGFVATGVGGAGRSTLETSVPGVFAIGDVRAGSTKRVAAAVGEGAQAIAAVHAFLAE